MLDALNNIDIAGWKNNPNVVVQIGDVIERASWKKSVFEPLMGRGEKRGIRTFRVEKNGAFRPRMKASLAGDGVVGNADLNTNYDNLEILSQTIYPRVVANSVKSEIKQYSDMQMIDFIKEASDSLTNWMLRTRDKNLITALSNDFTNVVVCDSINGYKDTTNEPSVKEATKKIKRGDVCNVKAIRRAIFMARSGINYKGKNAFPIKPINATTTTEGGITIEESSYIILLDSYAYEQLKNDVEWIEMQKYAGVRGNNNRIFTGFVGEIDGCPVLNMGVWTQTEAGFLNSEVSDSDFMKNINTENHSIITPPSTYAGTQPVCIGALIGAGSLVIAGSDTTKFYIDDTIDAGRKIVCGVDRLLAISKGRFQASQGIYTQYNDTDFATIGIFSSKE